MSCCKYQCVALFLLIAAMASTQTSMRDHAKRAKHLDDVITDVNLTAGTQTIGGASIVDAVNLLRDDVAFPVSLEMLEFERPKDFVTLQEALATLHSMQAITPLGDWDKSRLDRYEELVKTHDDSEVLVPRQRSFKLVRERISVREFLIQVTTVDDEYEWKNYGTDTSPQIVIRPRAASALNWPLTPICTPRRISIDRVLAGCKEQECGPFTQALKERNIGILYMYTGPSPPDPVPHGSVDLCDKNLTARDALNRIAEAAHTSWTLGGIKGMRFLSFSP
ncbi:MAG TPA: hypothetical protein VJS37_04860 [Terriglobales bacterium]|nr:hypothetical protein [Terriglobales bacterium]